MKQTTFLVTALALMAGASAVWADSFESFLDQQFASLESRVPGKFNIDSRLRYEEFDTAAVEDQGLSHRIRYGYTTADFSGFTAMVEGETVHALNDSDQLHFLDDAGDGTDLNQLWLQYADADYGKAKLGRQIYALDDHRFIGHVGWRQNIQTFDAATAEFTGIDNLSVKAFYLAEQNAVDGTHNELNAAGLNASYAFSKALKLTGFYYDIEGDDVGNANASNVTAGLRVTGAFEIDEVKFQYSASFAEQEETGPSALDYEAAYQAADLSAALPYSGITLGAGFEIFEPSFRTPLATVHKFNGFADAMLTSNGYDNGLEDLYVYAGYTIPIGNGIKTKLIYHWFDSESGAAAGENGGDEIDLVASYKINKYFSLMVKYGEYDADGGVGNRGSGDKRMFTFDLNFVY